MCEGGGGSVSAHWEGGRRANIYWKGHEYHSRPWWLVFIMMETMMRRPPPLQTRNLCLLGGDAKSLVSTIRSAGGKRGGVAKMYLPFCAPSAPPPLPAGSKEGRKDGHGCGEYICLADALQ